MKDQVKLNRDHNGIAHVEALDQLGVYWAMGYVHGRDRGMQMLLMRILVQGRLSELLDSSASSLDIDRFFRKMNWAENTEKELANVRGSAKSIIEAYVDGVNTAFKEKTPWEFKLMGYTPELWKARDTIGIARMVGYLSLSQSQEEIEKLIVEMIQNDVPQEFLEELFPGQLGGLDIDLLKKVKIPEKIVPASILWDIAIPRMMASNNWVISGKKTASGKPILANDPHLEVNRLPSVWHEFAAKVADRYVVGATMPGCPAFIIGRNPNLSWGVTYAFIDSIDSWIEVCKNGKYRRGDAWKEFKIRKEIIKRKKKAPVEILFYENDHGILQGEPTEDGYYLATKWTAAESGPASMEKFLHLWDANTVKEGMESLGQVEAFWSWVLADTEGNIGFQMSGLTPIRREGISGLIPLPGWDKRNDWLGFVNFKDLPRCYNPEQGFFSTANHDLNEFGNYKNAINMPMGSYRADRINELLDTGENFSSKDVFDMQYDVYSTQAEIFMKKIQPLLPDNEQGRILSNWDFKYDLESKGAYLFEVLYQGLLQEVFGKNGVGEDVARYFANETGLFIDFYPNFDRILLGEHSAWFNGKTRDQIFKNVIDKYLNVEPYKWGQKRKVLFKNILFDGKLPKFLGFDKGPYPVMGGRASIHQGQIFRSAGRHTTFFPSYRFVTDLAEDHIHTNIAGGPSDRRFSKWYASDLQNWLQKKYKTLKPSEESPLPF
jgi:penicillin amidase